ncbi:MAG: MATE family efflux transporter [Eubacteriales bacterium]|nr:MATE family efflux transporter [Eubacteriales bacterium]
MEQSKLLGTERINKLLLFFSVPSVISLVLNAIYNMVDQIFIGQGVGYLGNGATNVIFPLIQFAVAIGLLLGDGAANYMNLHLGMGEKEQANRGTAAGLAGVALVGIALTILFNLFLEPLCWLFGATQATLPYAIDYGRIISLGIFFCTFDSCAMSMIRADGSPRFAMMGLVAGCIVNLIGDPLTIFVFGMGVKGAALATILGQLVNMALYLWYFFIRGCRTVSLDRDAFVHAPSYMPRVAKLGISSFVTQFAVVIVIAIQNNVLVAYGASSKYGAEIPMTALGVTMKVFTVLQCAVTGLCSGAQPIFSFNYGSAQYNRVRETLKKVLLLSLAIMAVATVWFQLAPMSIIQIFGSADPLYNEFSVKCLRIFLALLVLDAFQMVGSSFLQSIGKPAPAAVLVIFRQLILLIPATFLFAYLFGVEGVLYSGPFAGLLVGLASAFLLLREWKQLGQSAPQPQSAQDRDA